jgi:hypothetical protein
MSLKKAFAEMNLKGITAKENYWCCQTCGLHAITHEDKNDGHYGFCFYHNQDNSSKKRKESFHLTFGHTSMESTDEQDVQVGKDICAILRANGCEVEWNESNARRIKVVKWLRTQK